jgi:hypothetical protein
MFTDIVNLGMAIVARGNAIIRSGLHDLLEFQAAVIAPGFGKPGLQKTAPAAAAKIVGPVRGHVDEIFFSDQRFNDEAQIFRHGIAQRLAHQLTRILNRKGDTQVFIPIGTDLELAFPDPLGIKLDDAPNLERVLNLEFIQSDPD